MVKACSPAAKIVFCDRPDGVLVTTLLSVPEVLGSSPRPVKLDIVSPQLRRFFQLPASKIAKVNYQLAFQFTMCGNSSSALQYIRQN